MGEVGRPLGGGKIVDVELVQMRRIKSRRECAEHFGVSIDAVKSAELRIRRKIENAPIGVSSNNIDAMEQLRNINDTITSQLRRCEKLVLREDKRIEEFDKITLELSQNPDDPKLKDKLKDMADSPGKTIQVMNAIVSVSGEVRKQIELNLKIAETLYNIQMMEEFQSEVIALIKEVDPVTAQKLIAKLKERRTIRGLMKPI